MNATVAQVALSLHAVHAQLSQKDQAFATSLLDSYTKRKGAVSEKQVFWMGELVKRASAPKPQRQTAEVGDMQGLLSLFDKAAQNLKRPAIVARAPFGEVRLSVAGPGASRPGTINVTDNGGFGDGVWYGRITRDGTFEQSARAPQPDGLVPYLRRFAAEPATVAAESGRLSGKCCFCNRALDDERSTAVGYGPVCAQRFDLPWGAK